MTAYLKKEPSELETCLDVIKKLKDSEINIQEEVIPPHLNPESNNFFFIKQSK
jgi:hypothetical protein